MIRAVYKRFNQYLYDLQNRTDQEQPDPRKIDIIKEYAKKFPQCRTFVETGTYFGATPLELRETFDTLVTIELTRGYMRKHRNDCNHIVTFFLCMG